MKISEVQIMPVKPKDGLVAFASLVLDSCLYISSIAVYTKLDGSGFRIVYPTKKVGERNINIFHPTNRAFNNFLEEEILKKINQIM